MATIRQATVEDVETLVRLRIELLQRVSTLDVGASLPDLPGAIRRYLLDAIPDGRFTAWLADALRSRGDPPPIGDM